MVGSGKEGGRRVNEEITENKVIINIYLSIYIFFDIQCLL